MKIYIDEKNLESFLNQKDNNLFNDVLKVLKRQLDKHFNFSKNRLKENHKLSSIIPILTSGVNETLTSFDNGFPVRPLKSNSANSFNSEQLSSILWVDDEGFTKLNNSGSTIVSDVGNEIKSIEQLFFFQNDYIFEKHLRIGSSNFSNWEHLKKFSMPLTDIIFIDNYILSSKEIIDCNIKEFISILLEQCNTKVNFVLFVHPDQVDGNIEDYQKEFKSFLRQCTGKSSNVTIIETRKEHDRTVITNYKRVYTGDTFNFWNNRGVKITKGREIEYSSFLKSENDNLKKELLIDLQEIINKNPENVFGDKLSGYLTF